MSIFREKVADGHIYIYTAGFFFVFDNIQQFNDDNKSEIC